MADKTFSLGEVVEGRNSVLFQTSENSVLYEKLANTVHSGTKEELSGLQKRIEAVEYRPVFETGSLKASKNDPPSVLIFEVTEQCNLRCDYCINSGDYPRERTYSPKKMSTDTADKALEEIVPLMKDTSMISFYGGEPLLNIDIINHIMKQAREKFHSKGLMFSMTTNFFNGDRYIKEIVDNGMYVNLSLDGPPEVHDRFRKTESGNPTYSRIRSNLDKVEEYSPGYVDSHFVMLSTCYDPADLEKIVRFFDNEELFLIHVSSVDKKGRPEGTLFPETDHNELNSEYINRILDGKEPKTLRRLFDSDLKAVALRDDREMPEELMLHGSCYPGRRRVFVDVNGEYHPCERFGPRLRIGSVYEGMSNILSERIMDTFSEIRNGLCTDCWAQRICKPCTQYAKDPRGEISAEGLSQGCGDRRKQLIGSLANYAILLGSNREAADKYFKSINPLFERG